MSHRIVVLAFAALSLAACNTDSVTGTNAGVKSSATTAVQAPVVVSTSPENGASGVARTTNITATFSSDMDPSTINNTTVILRRGSTRIWGVTLSYSNKVVRLNPNNTLASNATYTVTITTGARDADGFPMARNKTWSFTTVETGSNGPAIVKLGTAGQYVILAKTGVSTTGTTAVVGNIGLSPAAATYITGFGLIMDQSNTFSTSSLVTGKIFASNYTQPTPSKLTTAVLDMQTAYTDAAGRNLPDYTELGAGNINGMTLSPGLYKWSSGVKIPGNVTLTGDSNDVFIFQIAGNLLLGNGAAVTLKGGVRVNHIFWQVAGQTTLGTTSYMKGIVLCKTLIAMKTGAVMHGRALAQTAVTMDAVHLTKP